MTKAAYVALGITLNGKKIFSACGLENMRAANFG